MNVFLLNMTSRPTPEYGQIARHLRLLGHIVWVAALDDDGNLLWDSGDSHVKKQKGPRRYPRLLPKSRLFNIIGQRLSQLGYIRRLRAMIREMEPDVVHFNTSGMRFSCLLTLGLRRNRVFVLDFRQIGDRLLPVNAKIRLRNHIRSLTRGSAAKYCFDQSVYLHYLGAEKGLGRDWKRWGTVVPMGVDDSFLNVCLGQNGQAKKKNKVRFIYIGSMVQHRQLDTVFKAIKAVAEKRDDFEVHFLGRDKSEGYYPKLIKQLEIEHFVTILPLIPYSEVPQRLTEYDAAMAYVPYEPTDWTHHPTLKILEYRAVGIPIIASDVAPNFDSVENDQNGILCANTTEDFTSAMLKFIEDPQYRARLKENALQMREGLTWEKAVQMYEDLYIDLLARKRSNFSRSA